jgi:hypothetical protein
VNVVASVSHSNQIIGYLVIKSRMDATRYPVKFLVHEIPRREPHAILERMCIGDAYTEALLRNGCTPQVLIEYRHNTEADMQFSPEHALFKPYSGIRHQNDLGKTRGWRTLSLEIRQNFSLRIERMADLEWPVGEDG